MKLEGGHEAVRVLHRFTSSPRRRTGYMSGPVAVVPRCFATLVYHHCVQAFTVHTTQPVGCVRALGEAKVAQHGSLYRRGNECARGAQHQQPYRIRIRLP